MLLTEPVERLVLGDYSIDKFSEYAGCGKDGPRKISRNRWLKFVCAQERQKKLYGFFYDSVPEFEEVIDVTRSASVSEFVAMFYSGNDLEKAKRLTRDIKFGGRNRFIPIVTETDFGSKGRGNNLWVCGGDCFVEFASRTDITHTGTHFSPSTLDVRDSAVELWNKGLANAYFL